MEKDARDLRGPGVRPRRCRRGVPGAHSSRAVRSLGAVAHRPRWRRVQSGRWRRLLGRSVPVLPRRRGAVRLGSRLGPGSVLRFRLGLPSAVVEPRLLERLDLSIVRSLILAFGANFPGGHPHSRGWPLSFFYFMKPGNQRTPLLRGGVEKISSQILENLRRNTLTRVGSVRRNV